MILVLKIITCLLMILLFMGWVWDMFKFKPFKRIFHDVLGWHEPIDNEIEFYGCGYSSHCKYCGKEILQDSQGNWFAKGE